MDGPIFVIGIHRCGGTFWHNLLVTRPGLLRLGEPRFMGAPRQRDFRYFLKTEGLDLRVDADVEKMVELCFAKKNRPGLETSFWRFENLPAMDYAGLKKEVLRRLKASDRSLGAVARVIIEEMVRGSGQERACVRFPVDIEYLPELISWFPNCRIMHLTRDPRAMAMSKTNDPTGTAVRIAQHPRLAWLIRKAMVFFIISEYRKFARYHRRYQHLENYRLFRYEDLLAHPEKTLMEVCDFVGCAYSPDMLEPERGAHEHQPSSLTGQRHKGFDPSIALRWQKLISRLDRWTIDLLTGGSMRALKYDPKIHPIFRLSAKPPQEPRLAHV
ncbi:MAG TPA: sulfotransferase [Verrucomicrobiae bacterium]|nr:sulfotransferase [Verrucomicrobiae bacterium]